MPIAAITAGRCLSPAARRAVEQLALPTETTRVVVDVRPAVADVLLATAEVMRQRTRDLLSTMRGVELALARHVAMHVAMQRYRHRVGAVGRAVKRDRSTVRYGMLRIEAMLHDERVCALVDAVAARAKIKCVERLAHFAAAAETNPLKPKPKAQSAMVVSGRCKGLAARRALAAHPEWTIEQVMAATGLDRAAVDGARERLSRSRRQKPGDVIAADYLAGRSIAEIAAARAIEPGAVIRILRRHHVRPAEQGSAR